MRKIIIIACLLTALFQVQGFAQFSVAVNAGLAGLKYKVKDGSSKIKPGWGVDLGFTRTFNKHWGVVTGLGIMQYNTEASMNNGSTADEMQVDDMGAGFLYSVKTNGYKETQRFAAVNIPLMLQYRTANAERTQWYINAGAKLILPFDTKIKAEAQQIDMTGYYPDVNLEITNLPQHGFGSVFNWSSKSEYALKPEIAVAAATGLSFNLKNGYRLSIGVYADYGMTGMKKLTDQPLVTYSAPLTSASVSNSVLATNNAGFVRSLSTGIQFKLDFGKRKSKRNGIDTDMVDSDKDGITDSLDLCPCKAGCVAFKGCADSDNDGIPDNLDKCPDVKGLEKHQGCPPPDSDKDGVIDEEDKCPDVFGTLAYKGCPPPEKDRDRDGINDDLDKCPDIYGMVENQGCPVPDRDRDGVLDAADKCPDIPGPPANEGCPYIQKEVIMKTNLAAENILFETNTATLKTSSFPGLNEVAEIMLGTPGILLYIDGHTDYVGSETFNQVLSENRANAVLAYLKSKGIPIAQLHATGFGKSRPLADNKTPAGRQQNRRVELRLSYN
jgi:outer membrane protein OmpA-like peptidoglycan-associated protein